MNFLTAQQELGAQLGLNYLTTETAILLKRWLNFAYQDIVGWKVWSWRQGRDCIALQIDATETTLSVTASIALATPTTVTFSAAVAASQTGRFIQFEGSNDWYNITAHTATATTATISPAYVQTTALSAGDFTIRTWYYSFSSTTDKILNCRQANTPRYIPTVNADKIDWFDSFSDTTGNTELIYIWGQDSNKYPTFTPYPWPSESILLEFRVFKKATDLSGTTDEPIFPTRFDTVWIDRAKAYGLEMEDDTRSKEVFKRTEETLKRLVGQDRIGTLENSVIEAIDGGSSSDNSIRLPGDYPR